MTKAMQELCQDGRSGRPGDVIL